MHYEKLGRITLAAAVVAALALLAPGQAQACTFVCDGPDCGYHQNGGWCEERPFGCIEYICFANASEQEEVLGALEATLDALGDSPMTEEIVAALTDFPGARVIGLDGEVVFEGPDAMERAAAGLEGVETACIGAESEEAGTAVADD